MPRVFISYRRADANDITRGIHIYLLNALKAKYGEDAIFLDNSSNGGITPGSKFGKKILTALFASDVVLIIIGKQWMTLTKPGEAKARIFNTEDWVHKEVERALYQEEVSKSVVVPVLVNGASMPSENELPQALKNLAGIQAVRVDGNDRFDQDMEQVVKIVKQHLTDFDIKREEQGVGTSSRPLRPANPAASRHNFVVPGIIGVVLVLLIGGFFFMQSDFLNPDEPTDIAGVTVTTNIPTEEATNEPTATDAPTDEATAIDEPTDVPPTEPEAVPTEPIFSDGREIYLEYNGSSFYLHNRSGSIVAADELEFRALNDTGDYLSRYAFRGDDWANQYPTISPNRCNALEIISPTVPHLEPDYCTQAAADSIYHASSSPTQGSTRVFWIAQNDIAQFAVYWNGFEAGRCLAVSANGRQSCEILIGG